MPDISELLNLTPPVLLIAGINFLIWMLKVSFPSFPRNKIPIFCIVIGACIYPLQDKTMHTAHASILSDIIIGIMLGGCSVGLHQVFIQQLKSKFGIRLEGETEILVKTSSDKPTSVEITSTEEPSTKIDVK